MSLVIQTKSKPVYMKSVSLLSLLTLFFSGYTWAAETSSGRMIEEITVTAEKREATVSDTSIAITAMDQDFLEEMGIQDPDEMVMFIPAAVREDWDIKIRGVGRNFRAIGGDPGIATYYNGVYSPDFGIASTENGLYDLARVEVLRGPQGTLYGRNSVGGALNYITNGPTQHWEGELRGVLGAFNAREWFGVVSGPLIDDKLAFRMVGTVRDRDGAIEGIAGSPDILDVNDNNISLALKWDVTENIEVNLRGNDRVVDNSGDFGGDGAAIMFGEGPEGYRVMRDNSFYAFGLRLVDETFPGAFKFTHPGTGELRYGARVRPGVDPAPWPMQPNPSYMDPNVLLYDGGTKEDPNSINMDNGWSDQEFDHRAGSFDVTWVLNDNLTVKYIYGYQNFVYKYDRDDDYSSSLLSSSGTTVVEDVDSDSHELQLLWSVGDKLIGTTGFYKFKEIRLQHYGIRNRLAKGYLTNPTAYGDLLTAIHGAAAMDLTTCYDWRAVDMGVDSYGAYCGDPGIDHNYDNDTGAAYEHENRIWLDAYAVFTQVDYQFNDSWGVTLGLRWARDERIAFENRGGYSEQLAPWFNFGHFFVAPGAYPGLEQLSGLPAINLMMGNATANFLADGVTVDQDDPITPVCALTALTCDNPLRLAGIPLAWGSKLDGDGEWDDVNWRVNFNWEPTEDILIYFGATTGYRAGGFALGATDARDDARDEFGVPIPLAGQKLSDYGAEEVIAYEVGYKGMHFNSTLQVNAAAYMYDYNDYQDRVDVWDAIRQQGTDVVKNIPDIINKGFEIEFTWLPTDNLTVGGNYGYTISEYDTNFIMFNANDPRYPASMFGDTTVADGGDPSLVPLYTRNVNGMQIKGIPKNKGVIWGVYEWDTGMGIFRYRNVLSMTGEYFSHEFVREYERVPDMQRWDMRLTWTNPDQTLKVSAFIENVLDDTPVRRVGVGGEGSNWRQGGTSLYPRFFGIDATWMWGG